MLYICDFFVVGKEAISNEVELLRQTTNSKLFAAGIFMEQKHLKKEDLMNKRYIVHKYLYSFLLPIISILHRGTIHYFEEEPNFKRRFCFNISCNNLYITMYRRPGPKYIQHLKRYRKLIKVFVELDLHKKILTDSGIPSNKIEVISPPSIYDPVAILPKVNLDRKDIKLLFASWNGGAIEKLRDRGILYLFNVLKTFNNLSLDIVLRDQEILVIENLIKLNNLAERVRLHHIKNKDQLKILFAKTDFVTFLTPEKITKDVPNSVLDGFMLGKPCFISDAVDLSIIVKEKRLGIVIDNFKRIDYFSKISLSKYSEMVRNIEKYRVIHTRRNYLKTVKFYNQSA